jgi:hypothetical protein
MNEKVKAYLTAYCQKNNWATSDEDLREVLTEGKRVYKEIGAAHRWYDETFEVVNIDGMLIGFDYYHTTGDCSLRDHDLTLDLNTVCEVRQKERSVIYYEPVKNQ